MARCWRRRARWPAVKFRLLPVNLGGLGFLTAITLDQLYPELERAFRGEQRVVPRGMLHGDLVRGGQVVKSYEALNDIVICETQFARMIDLEAFVDSQYVSTFKADGLIVCTPTGSTAYSLSAGGPIVFPAVHAVCITPVCPHMLTNRPVLVPETSVIELISHAADHEAFLTVDGQVGEPLLSEDRVVCRSFRAPRSPGSAAENVLLRRAAAEAEVGRALKRLSLTAWIFIAMLLGVALGAAYPDVAKADWMAALANVFLRLIKSIIAPLIFGTLVYGIAGTGSVKTMGRIGLKAHRLFRSAHHYRAVSRAWRP